MANEDLLKKTSRKPATDNFVGFGSLPKQVRRKSVKKGFHFTLMVVGESGLGKSTLLNSLFLTDVYVDGVYLDPATLFEQTMTINESTLQLREGNVDLQLTVIDTPGFGDHIDNTDSWNAIIDNIEDKFAAYLNAESRVYRTPDIPDNRVHCCLYFIAPTGHGLKQLDIEFMKRLHNKINIVPLIAKADTLTAEECASFKTQILKEIEENEINVYKFPPLKHIIPKQNNNDYIDRIPFAVVGSNAVLEVGGKKIRGRKYPWGIVDVENLEHCDFLALRNLLVRSHMQDLIDVTNEQHYEMYRSDKLAMAATGGRGEVTGDVGNVNPLEQMEREREEREGKLMAMEREMEQVFSAKVNEKKKKLSEAENEFHRKYEDTMKQLNTIRREVEERRRIYEEEHAQFQILQGDGTLSKKDKKKHKHK